MSQSLCIVFEVSCFNIVLCIYIYIFVSLSLEMRSTHIFYIGTHVCTIDLHCPSLMNL